jgi:hypothetical protein
MLSLAYAQQKAEGEPVPRLKLTPDACKAIEKYIADIDAARSVKEKAKRDEKYAAALDALKAVVKAPGDAALIAEAAAYPVHTERVLAVDSTDPKLEELIELRLKCRARLLGSCVSPGNSGT